ncbi:unnamed protein product, partial [Ectocarpus sp. 12 AP-2014]
RVSQPTRTLACSRSRRTSHRQYEQLFHSGTTNPRPQKKLDMSCSTHRRHRLLQRKSIIFTHHQIAQRVVFQIPQTVPINPLAFPPTSKQPTPPYTSPQTKYTTTRKSLPTNRTSSPTSNRVGQQTTDLFVYFTSISSRHLQARTRFP